MPFTIETHVFYSGGHVPARYTCDGADVSPPLLWSGAPAGTRSFALVCRDPDAPSGVFYHWAIYDIPPSADRLPEHYPRDNHGFAAAQAINDFGRPGYGGPCPPPRRGPHRYVFRLYALDTDHLPVKRHAKASEIDRMAEQHSLAQAELMGMYER